MGDQFSVQLENLDKIANVRLPGMADCLRRVRGLLNKAVDESDGAFSISDEPVYRLFEGVEREFDPAANFLGRVLDDNAENLSLAAQALREIAHRYRQADGQA
ncbi:hypothetical protein [Lentzea sp. E54]|uniref:hypothetical protein n=1 Tax=Lentzea xerophila TaxID=3435883 RepID=UPI003DA68E56